MESGQYVCGSHADGNRDPLASSQVQLTFKTEWLYVIRLHTVLYGL